MLVVSNYHYIRSNFKTKFPSIYGITPEDFERQLIELSKHGEFVSQADLLSFINKPINKNIILITFDDGLKEQYELARPILQKLGIPFIFFINTSNFVDKKVSEVHKVHLIRSEIDVSELNSIIHHKYNFKLSENDKILAEANYSYDEKESAHFKYLLNFKLSQDQKNKIIQPIFSSIFNEEKVFKDLYFTNEQLKKLSDENSLGSHSHNHYPLGTLDPDNLKMELEMTQNFFLSNFGEKATSISYPYGSYESVKKISNACSEYGFKLGFTMERAANKKLHNPLLISRFDSNDMPLGKNCILNEQNLFKNIALNNWYEKENSFINQ